MRNCEQSFNFLEVEAEKDKKNKKKNFIINCDHSHYCQKFSYCSSYTRLKKLLLPHSSIIPLPLSLVTFLVHVEWFTNKYRHDPKRAQCILIFLCNLNKKNV